MPLLHTALILLFSLALATYSLSRTAEPDAAAIETDAATPRPQNAVYYWKTTFSLHDEDSDFLRRHRIRRIYLRMFDVVAEKAGNPSEATVPNATVRFSDGVAFPDSTAVVPVVYITLDALRAEAGREQVLAQRIAERVRNMCSYNSLPHASELQLDCDWTASTEASFFELCRRVREALPEGWKLSSTIRLHQLSHTAPPVDRGVLMVYNTGSFNDPDAANSIIDRDDVAPYLRHLSGYTLPLDVAYPAYSWQLLFRGRSFLGLLRDIDTSDTTAFASDSPNRHIALRDIPTDRIIIRKGDVIRTEQSAYAEISAVKRMIEARLADRPHSNIIYHLDHKNLRRYSNNEIKNILN